jgi:F0F1-type ATP synthase assembly protein I
MFVIAGAVLGILIGVLIARKRGGKPADMVQYGASLSIALAIVGVFVTVIVHRMAV